MKLMIAEYYDIYDIIIQGKPLPGGPSERHHKYIAHELGLNVCEYYIKLRSMGAIGGNFKTPEEAEVAKDYIESLLVMKRLVE